MAYDFELGPWSRTISTRSQTAQDWFDRGLAWTYAYNHEEAVVCFRRALAADPACAMYLQKWELARPPRPTNLLVISMTSGLLRRFQSLLRPMLRGLGMSALFKTEAPDGPYPVQNS